jgi:transcriptional regulator
MDTLHGTLDALVLKSLSAAPRHGYGIVRWLHERSGDGLTIEEGSLYPALYRMERDGWIESGWGTSELGRKAKFYRVTPKGRRQLKARTAEFASFVALVSPILLHT